MPGRFRAATAAGGVVVCSLAVVGGAGQAAGVTAAPIGPRTVLAGGWGDGGPAVQARLASSTVQTAELPTGELLYHEYQSNSIEKVAADGTVSCIADCAHLPGFAGDGGPATQARLSSTFSFAVAPDGSLYVADTDNHRLRRISAAGTITTVAGTGSATTWTASGSAAAVDITPGSATVAPDGTVYFEDAGVTAPDGSGGVVVRRLSSGSITTVLGGAVATGPYAGWDSTWNGHPATNVHLGATASLQPAAAPSGSTLYVAALDSGLVLKIAVDGTVTTVAGVGDTPSPSSGDGGLATAANFASLTGVVTESDGTLDVADAEGIRHIVVGGDVTLLHAGAPVAGFSGSGGTFYGVAPVAATGGRDMAIVATAAGGGQTLVVGAHQERTGDGGQAKDAWFRQASDTAVLPDGGIVVSQSLGTLREIGTDGIVRTIAGTDVYASSFSGEGGLATAAVLPGPKQLAVDAAGDIFVSCADGRVRKILHSDGTIHTVLGSGSAWSGTALASAQPPSSVALGDVRSMSVAPDGSLWVVDLPTGQPFGGRVLTLSADGSSARQVTGLASPLSGAAAAGASVGAIATVDAAGVSPTGALVLLDGDGYEYLAADRSTIGSVSRGFGTGWTLLRFDPSGNVVLTGVSAVRYNGDHSSDTLSTSLDVGADSPVGTTVTASAAYYLTGQGLLTRTIPAVVARPATPAVALGGVPGSASLGIHLTAPLPSGQSLTGFGYAGSPSPLWQPASGLWGFNPFPDGDLPMGVPSAGLGGAATGVVWVYDATTGETSVPRTVTYANRTPVLCPISPASRVVAYGATVTPTAAVTTYEPTRQTGVPGTWTVTPGGLAASRFAATATSATGATAHVTKILRTTTVTYAVTAGEWTACTSRVVYSVRGAVRAVPSATSVKHSAAFRITVSLTPRIAGQRMSLQSLVGKRWVTVAHGTTASTGMVALSLKAPSRAGAASYRVVSTTSAALTSGVSGTVRVRIR